MKDKYIVVGISGATNAGKTTLTTHLKEDFPDVHIINMDDYFVEEDSPQLNVVPGVNHANWEELSAIQFDRLHDDVRKWIADHKDGPTIDKPPVLILEGILIFNYKPLLPVFHKKYFLTLSKEKCWERRKHRVYIPPDPPGYFDVVVWPMYLKNKEDLLDITDIEYVDGMEDGNTIYDQVHKGLEEILN